MSLFLRSVVLGAAVLTTAASGAIFATPPTPPMTQATARSAQAGRLPAVTVYKDPNCGCCSLWVTHMERAGFAVTAINTPDMPALRAKHGVPQHTQSCHTAVVDGYVVEGHVPADDVKKLLASRPNVKGLAVPGMPMGSPGMEQGTTRHAYSVLAFDEAGRTTVFARH